MIFITIQKDGYTITPLIITCSGLIYYIYFFLALGYKVVIHVIGLVLAFLTRKVKVDPLNDLVIIVAFPLSGENVYYVVFTSLIFVGQCAFLGLTFVPKVRHCMQCYIELVHVRLQL